MALDSNHITKKARAAYRQFWRYPVGGRGNGGALELRGYETCRFKGAALRPRQGGAAPSRRLGLPQMLGDGLSPRANVELLIDMPDMSVNGGVGQAEFVGDLLVEITFGQQLKDLGFAR